MLSSLKGTYFNSFVWVIDEMLKHLALIRQTTYRNFLLLFNLLIYNLGFVSRDEEVRVLGTFQKLPWWWFTRVAL